MKIAIAQIKPMKGDVSANIELHKKIIQLAISHNSDAVFFPELSMTGYEPELSNELAINQEEPKFDDFQKISDTNRITISIGMPTRANLGIQISMIIFQPNVPKQIYSKQQLHADEFLYFVNGERQIVLTIKDKKIAPAICYESLQYDHAERASKLGAGIYIASVAKSQNGVEKAMLHYPAIAKEFSMPVLMSNCVGHCDNFMSVGQSSIWTKRGDLVKQLDAKCEGLLIFDTETENVIEDRL